MSPAASETRWALSQAVTGATSWQAAVMQVRSTRWLIPGALAVAGFRWLLCVQAPDLIHPVDPAELELLWLAQQELSWEGLIRRLGAASAVHHGGFLPVSLTAWLATLVLGSSYAALKATAVLWSTAAWAAWTALALRLGGRRAGLLAGLALALPVPWASQWWLTAWGSHPEASLLVAAWLLAFGGRPLVLGLLAGFGVAFAPVLAPTGIVLLVARRRSLAVLGAVLGWLPLQLGALSTPWPWLSASLTEDPAQTLPGLIASALSPSALTESVAGHLPVPLVASQVAPAALSWLLGGLLLVAGAVLARRDRRPVVRLLLALPVLHLATVVSLSPFRPALQHRYLLPWLPAVLLWPALAAASGRLAPWAVVALVPSLLAAPVYGDLLTRPAPADLFDYHPAAYLGLGLDRVPLALVPDVEVFLAARGQAATEGFSAAWSRRWGYPVLGEPFAELVVRPGLKGRLRGLVAEGAPAEAVAADAGWGVAVLTGWDVDATLAALAHLEELREPAWRGVGEGVAARGDRGFLVALAQRDPQAAAWAQVALRPQ